MRLSGSWLVRKDHAFTACDGLRPIHLAACLLSTVATSITSKAGISGSGIDTELALVFGIIGVSRLRASAIRKQGIKWDLV